MSAIFFFTTKTTQPRPQVFSVNGAERTLLFLRHFLVKHKILPNWSSVNGYGELCSCFFSQSESEKYFEGIKNLSKKIFGIFEYLQCTNQPGEKAG